MVLDVPFTYAVAVNDRHHVLVGATSSLAAYAGFLWSNQGQINELPFSPAGMNNDDEIVGFGAHAVLYANGVTHNLNDLIDPGSDWQLLYAFDINDQGQIVGLGKLHDSWTGFLLTPVP
jgi:hypothetical protein